MNNFDNDKKNILNEISNALKSSIDDFNERENSFSNEMFTAAIAYLGILFAFSGYIKSSEINCSLGILASAILFLLSLVFKLIDFLIVRIMYRKHIKLSKKILSHAHRTTDNNSLYAIDSIAADLLNDEKDFTSSSVPIILQMVSLVLGIIVSVVTLSISSFI